MKLIHIKPTVIASIFCALTLLFFSCASQHKLTRPVNGQIKADEILDHIGYLASDELEGRRSGTKGGEKAAGYIASEYERYGLKPVGDDGSYFQHFDFVFDVDRKTVFR